MRRLLLTLAIGLIGCVEPSTRQSGYTPENPIRLQLPPEQVQANTKASTRVDSLARAILLANPHIDAKPIFQTIGSPQPEIFHNGMARVVITQGLVESCQRDEELAAVLCFELGRMVAEREAVSPVNKRHANPLPPMDPGGPHDVGFGGNDVYRLDQLKNAEQDRLAARDVPPDPNELARTYLKRAGFSPDFLDKVKPQLREANRHSALEQQLGPGAAPGTFTPPVPH
ncbi:MAG: hypothetical protein ACJ8F7_18855 [Gemmataceae bacterium]